MSDNTLSATLQPKSEPATSPPPMKYNNLGRSGLKVSKIILGAMGYGDPVMEKWVITEDKALPLLEHAYKRGINTWDTVGSFPLTPALLSGVSELGWMGVN